MDLANAIKSKVETLAAEVYAAAPKTVVGLPVPAPVVRCGNSFGRLTVELSFHWNLEVDLRRAVAAAGLQPSWQNYSCAIWDLPRH